MTFAIPATVYNKKYNFIFIFFPTYLPNFSKKKSVNQLIKLEWPKQNNQLHQKNSELSSIVLLSFSVFSLYKLLKIVVRKSLEHNQHRP